MRKFTYAVVILLTWPTIILAVPPDLHKRLSAIEESSVATLSALTTYSGTAETVYVRGRFTDFDGYQGLFQFSYGDWSAEVALDTRRISYVAPDGEDGSEGAWLRVMDDDTIRMEWAGVSPSETAANNVIYGNAAIALLGVAGNTITYTTAGITTLNDYWEIEESDFLLTFGPEVIIKSDSARNYLLYVHGTDRNTRISNFTIQGGTFDGNSRECDIGVVTTYADNYTVMDVEANDFRFDGISCGGGQKGVLAPTDNDVKVLDCSGTGNNVFGLIVNKVKGVEVSGCFFDSSGHSDYDIKNCADINIHDNTSDSPTKYGLNIRCSAYGQDVYGVVANNSIYSTGKGGIWIHDDQLDVEYGGFGGIRDIVVIGNTVHDASWSGIDVYGNTTSILHRATIANNVIYNSGTNGISLSYAYDAAVYSNIIDTTGGIGIALRGVQDSSCIGNYVRDPAENNVAFRLRDGADGVTYCLLNYFTGNNVYLGKRGSQAFREYAGDNSDYNSFEANVIIYGWTGQKSGYQLTGPHSTATGWDVGIINAIIESIMVPNYSQLDNGARSMQAFSK